LAADLLRQIEALLTKKAFGSGTRPELFGSGQGQEAPRDMFAFGLAEA